MRINDEFTAERDTHGWTLRQKVRREWFDPELKKFVPTEKEYLRYYSNFRSLCKSVVDISVGQCEDLMDVMQRYEELESVLAPWAKRHE